MNRALSAAYDEGAFQWRKVSILLDSKEISVVSKLKKKKFSALLRHQAVIMVMPLGPFDLLAWQLLEGAFCFGGALGLQTIF